ncbi:MAG: hypothetical protein QXK88_04460 [Desulfurococcaceae archaeon]
MARLNILVDFTCPLGYVSRHVKLLKDSGFAPRLISYETIRLRSIYSLRAGGVGSTLDDVERLFSIIRSSSGSWKTCCLEIWIESRDLKKDLRLNRLIKLDGLCIYARPSRKGRVIYKLAWGLNSCREEGVIPESVGRKCLDTSEVIDDIYAYVRSFISYAVRQMLGTNEFSQ